MFGKKKRKIEELERQLENERSSWIATRQCYEQLFKQFRNVNDKLMKEIERLTWELQRYKYE